MKNTKKLLTVFLCAGLTVSSLTGCAAGDRLKNAITNGKSSSKKSESSTSELTEIKNAKSYITLSDYKTINLKTADIDKQVESKIAQDLESYTSYKKIKKGKVKKGDTVNIYYEGKVDGKAFEGGSLTKETSPEGYDLEIGSGTFIAGFEDQLIGKTIGKTYDINVTFPDPYTSNTDLSGKAAVFTITINSKQGKKIEPKLNDAFVKKNLTDYTSVQDYKTQTRTSVIRSLAVSKVTDDSKIKKYPKAELNAMKKQLTTSIETYLKQNNATLKDYLAQMNSTEDAYNKQVESTAKDELASRILYNAIAQAENLTVSDKDYQTELKTYLKNYSAKDEKALNKKFTSTYGVTAKSIIYNDLLYDKVADYLAGNVKES